ncbi:SOS response-associated peptidase [Filimonas effusa]|uniref:Abasic site processing protein n=1 Tax=Filimonas effusa TaxID=2508721 RepID=A0A4Q1DDH1_9BACT|nr:SOS response-associated peptidase family protein [Filimonas effusa]RXK87018.1 DUF159 family protein [Filimonas effusa]
MCYDISFTVDLPELRAHFPDLVMDENIQLNLEAAEHILGPGFHGEHAILYRNRTDHLVHLRLHEWGVIPFYINTPDKINDFKKSRNGFLNVRAERILDDKTSYWFKIRERRCLIPVTGIIEHREVVGFKNSIPYLVWPCSQKIFFLPGLYSVAAVPDQETGELIERRTFALITRPANELMKKIHNSGANRWRMPLFLPLELSQTWLNNTLTETEYRRILNYEIPAEDLAYRTTFSVRGNKLRPDGLSKIAPYSWNEPPLGTADPIPKTK